jgi:hypothetical protein
MAASPLERITISAAPDRRAFDRRLFMIAAILFPLIVLLGFSRTYYLRALFGGPPLPSMLVHVHGLLMTAWVALFVTQVGLVSTHNVRRHQRLGYWGIGLGALVILIGVFTALRAAKYGSTATPPEIPPLAFLIVPLFDLLMFALLFGGAIYYRRQPAAHKALMLLTAVNFVPPAIARIQVPALQAMGPLWFFGFPTVVALVSLGLETWRHRRLNWVFLAGTVALIASYVVRLALMTTGAWMRVARFLTSYV